MFSITEERPAARQAAVVYSTAATIEMINAAIHFLEVRNPVLVWILRDVTSSSQKKMTRTAIPVCRGQLIEKNT